MLDYQEETTKEWKTGNVNNGRVTEATKETGGVGGLFSAGIGKPGAAGAGGAAEAIQPEEAKRLLVHGQEQAAVDEVNTGQVVARAAAAAAAGCCTTTCPNMMAPLIEKLKKIMIVKTKKSRRLEDGENRNGRPSHVRFTRARDTSGTPGKYGIGGAFAGNWDLAHIWQAWTIKGISNSHS